RPLPITENWDLRPDRFPDFLKVPEWRGVLSGAPGRNVWIAGAGACCSALTACVQGLIRNRIVMTEHPNSGSTQPSLQFINQNIVPAIRRPGGNPDHFSISHGRAAVLGPFRFLGS